MKPNIEERLDGLREEARANGVVSGRGVDVAGGPIPLPLQPRKPGYNGEPVIRPPVWTWEIPLYFFIGGFAGMVASVGCAAWLTGRVDIAQAAFWLMTFGAATSPVLLIMDLGRPLRFLNMLRVFKYQSPMSVGAWILSAFGTCAMPGMFCFLIAIHHWLGGDLDIAAKWLAALLLAGAAFFGIFLATYTGVLIGATVVPAWFLHRKTLPAHFGTVGVGSAVSLLQLFGYHSPALAALGLLTAGIETVLWLLLEIGRHGKADRAVHSGASGWMIRGSDLLTGPLSLGFRLLGWTPIAAGCFCAGGLLSRFGWVAAGRASAKDPEAVFASQS